jgi:hypothetical protein
MFIIGNLSTSLFGQKAYNFTELRSYFQSEDRLPWELDIAHIQFPVGINGLLLAVHKYLLNTVCIWRLFHFNNTQTSRYDRIRASY